MKNCQRLVSLLLAAVLAVTCLGLPALASEDAPRAAESSRYYGDRLNNAYEDQTIANAANAFYRAMENMDFASGESVSVSDSDVLALAEAYAIGKTDLIQAFGAAVDSFRYDHMEYFYVDWDMLSVNVTKTAGGEFSVEIGAGRSDSYLLEKNADKIEPMVQAYNEQLAEMATNVRLKIDGLSETTDKEKSKIVHDAVCERVTYSFCESDADFAPYIRTAYGALVNGYAVCEGYARLYKAVMNEIGMDCELINGYVFAGESFEPHMWNYVRASEADETGSEGVWYAVDTTIDDGYLPGKGNTEGATGYGYFWKTSDVFELDHMESPLVSSVQYRMPYPKLKKDWESPVSSGLFKTGMEPYGNSDDDVFWISYDGLSAQELLDQRGLYMAFRTVTTNKGNPVYSDWSSVVEYNRLFEGICPSVKGKTYFLGLQQSLSEVEAAVFDIPDDRTTEIETESGTIPIAKFYSEDAVEHHMMEKTVMENPLHNPDYIAPAYIDDEKTEPSRLFQLRQDITKTQHIKLVYQSELCLVDGDGNIVDDGSIEPMIEWHVSSFNNYDLDESEVKEYAKLENVEMTDKRTIEFDFTPSRQYHHNMIWYNFTYSNLKNVRNDGQPGVLVPGFTLVYAYNDVYMCSRVFGDGRLKINTYAQPILADNSDLSMKGWKYPDGTNVSENQRAQMSLVVTQPADSGDLERAAANELGDRAAVKKFKTYEIDLNICGKVPQIPNGSYLRLNLGFPDGFNPNDAGSSFKLYHFKRLSDGSLDYDNVEEVDCVVTEYGIVATVQSFSPYVLIAYDNTMVPDNTQSISTEWNGKGGTVVSSTGKPVNTLRPGESVTYTITPDEGYEVEYVLLNGESQTLSDGKLTLAYHDLIKNNSLHVGFVATAVKKDEEEQGVENAVIQFVTNTTTAPSSPGETHRHVVQARAEDSFCLGEYSVYWHCEDCGGNFADEACTTEIAFAKHQLVPVERVPATISSAGVMAHQKCTVCGLLFDLDGRRTTAEALAIPMLTPDYDGGDDDDYDDYDDDDDNVSSPSISKPISKPISRPSLKPSPKPSATTPVKPLEMPTVQTSTAEQFSDLKKDAWYYEPVRYIVDTNLMSGVGGGRFNPEGTLDRAMLCQILYNQAGKPAVTGGSFTDVSQNDWFADAVNWAAAEGILQGYSDGSSGAKNPITREQLALILYRRAGSPTLDGALGIAGYSDADAVSVWAADAIHWAVLSGIVNGKNDRLDPQGHATRAEAAAMVVRFLKLEA